MGYAFISYSSKNQTSADAMRELFKKHNIDTWMAPYDIPAGSEYAEVLYGALTGCSCLVLMLTDESQNSHWVKKEVNIAITNGKPIIPVKLEDIELNGTMQLYLIDQQIVPVHIIEEESAAIQNILNSVIGFVEKSETKAKENTQPKSINTAVYKQIELTVWSPVNTDVYLNDLRHLIMRIDRNTGFDYRYNSISVVGEFKLIFVSNGFKKTAVFDSNAIGDRLEYRLDAILSKKEIIASYDRDEAVGQLQEEPTAYAFNQLAAVGTAADIDLLLYELNKLTSVTSKTQHTNYLIATCVSALGALAVKYEKIEKADIIFQIYENYEAKSSYGYMFEPILKRLKEREALRKTEIKPVVHTVKNVQAEGTDVPRGIQIHGTVMTVSSMEYIPSRWDRDKRWDNVRKIILGKDVEKIAMEAFCGMKELREVVFPLGLKRIGFSSFKDCRKLNSVVIPESVTAIAAHAFEDCTSLSVITIPSSVQYIGESAFWGSAMKGIRVHKDCVICNGNYGYVEKSVL